MLDANGKLDMSVVEPMTIISAVTAIEPVPPLAPADAFTVPPGGDVVINLRHCDDSAKAYLNKSLVISMQLGQHKTISLQSGLLPAPAKNTFVLQLENRPTAPGGRNFWAIKYTIGIFKANHEPAFPLLDIDEAQESGQEGIVYTRSFEFNFS
jgi:hypothetical protein